MRILITNDDGINAPGLQTLTKIAQTLAGSDGEVWIVAPAFEQSGVGHCISYTHPTMISHFGPRRFAIEGSPADCVLAGLHHVMPERPDLVLSGVNRGNNSAENTLYSGTIGAAMEAALQGIPAFALSQYFGPDNTGLADPFEASAMHLAPLIARLRKSAPWGGDTYQLFYNINVPPVAADAVKGARASAQGYRGHGRFTVEPHKAPSGRQFLWVKGGDQQTPTAPGTDAADNLGGYISVTPMRADLTDRAALSDLDTLLS
jgi:5'-nucleotidase